MPSRTSIHREGQSAAWRAFEHITRRRFLSRASLGLGAFALPALLGRPVVGEPIEGGHSLTAKAPPLPARAKRIIYLHMEGGPSQIDLWDRKPELEKRNGEPCPESLLKQQTFAFIKGRPKLLGAPHPYVQCGSSGLWVSQLLPRIGALVDKLTIVRSMTTDQFNHAPAQLLLYTGQPRFGYPSMGSWVTYGLGSENEDLPGFIVLVSGGRIPASGKQIWGSGFLPGLYQGVHCRSEGDPILFVTNPPGMDRQVRRQSLDTLVELNRMQQMEFHDPETETRIAQFELAFRMQTAVPEVMEIAREPKDVLAAYGAEPGAASFANNCLLARRLIEHGVRFVQVFDWGWDEHGTGPHDDLMTQLPLKCRETDQATAALILDLEQRGLLEDTLVIWGGEFGRTSMMEARGGSTFLGRDHHPHAFTMFFVGGGMRPGLHGATDDLGYFVTEGKRTVRDLQATILHLLGFDPFRLSYPFQGLNARLIGPTNEARIAHEWLQG